MNRLVLWVWGTFIGLSSVTLLLTNSVSLSVGLAAMAAGCVWLSTVRVTDQWRRRADADGHSARDSAWLA